MKRNRSYDRSFKEQTVKLSYESSSVKELAEVLGIHPDRIYSWRKEFATYGKASFSGNSDGITFTSSSCNSHLSHRESTSYYKPLDRASTSLYISTDSDFITVSKPLEATTYIGIDGACTRITVDALQFSDESYIQAVTDGFKLSGNTVFLGNLSSESFASGFSGYDWSILNNLTTGNRRTK